MFVTDCFQLLLVPACLVFALNYHRQGLRLIMFPAASWKRSSDQNITSLQLPTCLNRCLAGFRSRLSEVFLQHPPTTIHISRCLVHLCPKPCSSSVSITIKQTFKNQKRDATIPSLPPTKTSQPSQHWSDLLRSSFTFVCELSACPGKHPGLCKRKWLETPE